MKQSLGAAMLKIEDAIHLDVSRIAVQLSQRQAYSAFSIQSRFNNLNKLQLPKGT